MWKFHPLLLFIVILMSCRVNTQQMTMSENVSDSKSSIYKQINVISDQIKNNPSNENLLNDRANLYLKINEFESAMNDIDRGLTINAKSEKLYYTKTLIYYKKKHLDSALESIGKAINITRTERNLFLQSNIYYAQGEIREAILDLNSILELNPQADYIYLQKALWCNDLNMFYEEMKNYLYYIKISKDIHNVNLVKKRLKKIQKSDKYYTNLIKQAKKDIRKNGYPWEYHTWE